LHGEIDHLLARAKQELPLLKHDDFGTAFMEKKLIRNQHFHQRGLIRLELRHTGWTINSSIIRRHRALVAAVVLFVAMSAVRTSSQTGNTPAGAYSINASLTHPADVL
jgi:hypothetical protein